MGHKVIDIAASLAYAEQRQIKPQFKNENCTMLQLAFKKWQGLPEHSTPIDAYLHVIEGECELTMSGETFTLKVNDAIVLPKGEVHEVWAKTCDVRMLLTR